MVIDIIFNFGLEIVVGILIVIVLLQHRKMNTMEKDIDTAKENIIDVEQNLHDDYFGNLEKFDLHASWIRRVESKIEEKTSEDESAVQLLQEASKKVH